MSSSTNQATNNIISSARLNIPGAGNSGDDLHRMIEQVNQLSTRLNDIDQNLLFTKTEHDHLVDTVSDLSKKIDTSDRKLDSGFNRLEQLLGNLHAPCSPSNHTVPRTDEESLINIERPSAMESFLNATHGVRSSSSVMPAQPLPKFNGKPEEAAAWLREYELATGLNFWSDAGRVRGVGGCLTDDAEKWFLHRYMVNIPSDIKWSHFREEFCKTYFRKSDKLRLFQKILAHTQKPGDRLSTFLHDTVALCYDYDAKMSEDDVITHFLRGVRPFYKGTLCACIKDDRHLNNLEDAIRAIEDSEEDNNNKVDNRRKTFSGAKRSNSVTSNNEELGSSRERRLPKDYLCFNCSKAGHMLRDCDQPQDPVRIKANSSKSRQGRQNSPRSVGLVEDVPPPSISSVDYEEIIIPQPWEIVPLDIQIGSVDGVSATLGRERATQTELVPSFNGQLNGVSATPVGERATQADLVPPICVEGENMQACLTGGEDYTNGIKM